VEPQQIVLGIRSEPFCLHNNDQYGILISFLSDMFLTPHECTGKLSLPVHSIIE